MTDKRILYQGFHHQAEVFTVIQRFARGRRTLSHVKDRVHRRHRRHALRGPACGRIQNHLHQIAREAKRAHLLSYRQQLLTEQLPAVCAKLSLILLHPSFEFFPCDVLSFTIIHPLLHRRDSAAAQQTDQHLSDQRLHVALHRRLNRIVQEVIVLSNTPLAPRKIRRGRSFKHRGRQLSHVIRTLQQTSNLRREVSVGPRAPIFCKSIQHLRGILIAAQRQFLIDPNHSLAPALCDRTRHRLQIINKCGLRQQPRRLIHERRGVFGDAQHLTHVLCGITLVQTRRVSSFLQSRPICDSVGEVCKTSDIFAAGQISQALKHRGADVAHF